LRRLAAHELIEDSVGSEPILERNNAQASQGNISQRLPEQSVYDRSTDETNVKINGGENIPQQLPGSNFVLTSCPQLDQSPVRCA